MSVSGISTSSLFSRDSQSVQNDFQKFRHEFEQLGKTFSLAIFPPPSETL